MGVGVSIFTITLGLILKFAIAENAMKDPVDVHVIGVILIIVGGASFLLQLLLMSRMQQRPSGGRLLRSRQNERDAPYDPDSRPPG